MNQYFPFFIIFLAHFSSNIILSISIYDHHDNQGIDIDRVALLAIKSEITHDPQGALNSWNDTIPVCQWQGVTCGTKRHRVASLYLVSTDLEGTLSPSVGNLSFLHHLHLSSNAFRGQIPPQIGYLSRLRSLVLERNSFEGQVPVNISCCLNLESIGLGGNNLSGNLPTELGRLSKLTVLSLQDNRFTGNIFDIVVNMTSLEALSAPINSFTGSIPHSIGKCTNLIYISLAQNKISGTIPPSFYNLSSLQVIDLDLNQLEGSLPQDIGFRFPQLTSFKISGNSFHGHVPLSLSNLTHLVILSIYSNNFTGKFMFSARNMPYLKNLDISLNYLGTGEADDLSFIQTLVNCSNLQLLGCGSNNFGGILPNFLGNLTTELTVVDFRENQITGTIPFGLFNLINLEKLHLSGNQLTGYLPPQISKLKKLEILLCSGNNFAGNIPYSLGNLSRLSSLYLDYNNFKGSIPSSLGDCTNLLYLFLSQNDLSGALPPHLFHASMLVEVHLDHNHLQGTVPVEIGQLRNLVVLDVSGNAFSGEVPSTLGECINLLELKMGGNLLSGTIPESFKSLASLRLLNLSHNRLSGQIPDFLSKFSMIGLDLSSNNLKGEVPSNGAFANLTAVSVSGNSELCGGILELKLPKCPTKATTGKLRRKRKLSLKVILIIVAACLISVLSMVSSIYLLCFRRKRTKLSQGLSMKETFSKVSYDMLLKATDRFSEANLLGKGSFGSVYKGVLDPENAVVAVKVINLEHEGASKSFMAECNALRNIRHRNLLKIITACSSTDFQGNDFKALVYEFMLNGNLQQWVHGDQEMSLLQRMNIAIDVACALDYLHNCCEVPIIHCDLKPSNILLDNDMVAHIGDFGLARLRSQEMISYSSSVVVKGTVGYAAPEYGLGSMVSKEGDIYSYGIVLIEMMTAKIPTHREFEGGLNLHIYAKEAFPDQLTQIIDPRLLNDKDGTDDENQDENLATNDSKIECIKSVIEIGVKCSAESPQDRMCIEDAIKGLQFARDILLRPRNRRLDLHRYM